MSLVWTRTPDSEHNGRPTYEYHATAHDRTYHIVWAYDHGGTFGYTARSESIPQTYLHPTRDYAIGITWCGSLKRCKAACEAIEARYSKTEAAA